VWVAELEIFAGNEPNYLTGSDQSSIWKRKRNRNIKSYMKLMKNERLFKSMISRKCVIRIKKIANKWFCFDVMKKISHCSSSSFPFSY
jgi:hypothetical protein